MLKPGGGLFRTESGGRVDTKPLSSLAGTDLVPLGVCVFIFIHYDGL